MEIKIWNSSLNVEEFLELRYYREIKYENNWFVALLENRLRDMNWLGRRFWAWVPGAFEKALEKWSWKVWKTKTILDWKKEAATEID